MGTVTFIFFNLFFYLNTGGNLAFDSQTYIYMTKYQTYNYNQ